MSSIAPLASAPAPASAPPVASAPRPPVSASWPKPDTPPPAEEDWSKAEAINTADPKQHAPGCTLVHLGEWFRATCKGQFVVVPEGDLGKPGRDYFTRVARDAVVTIRARPGAVLGVGIGSDPTAHLRIAWPTNAPAPTVAMLDKIQTTTLEIALPKEAGDIPMPPPVDPSDTQEPAPADWIDAAEVNTAPKATRLRKCSLRVMRRWVRRDCADFIMDVSFSGAGAPGKDYFNHPDLFRSVLIVRLREGMFVKDTFFGGEMNIYWPTGEPKPTVIEAHVTR